MKRYVLHWLPVILLPAGNVLADLTGSRSWDVRLLLFSLLGAVAEELFFRFFLLKLLFLPRMKPVRAILLVSVLFAAMHLLNLRAGAGLAETLVQAAFALCFSVWAGAVVWRTRSVLIPLLAHVLLNLTAAAEIPWVSLLIGLAVLLDGLILIKDQARNG